MKKFNTNPIDQYFRDKLQSPELEYKEDDWKGLEQLLKPKKKKSFVWYYLSGIAAALFIVLSLWFLRDEHATPEKISKSGTASPSDKPEAGIASASPETSKDRKKGELAKVMKPEKAAGSAGNSYPMPNSVNDHKISGELGTRDQKDLALVPISNLPALRSPEFSIPPINKSVQGSLEHHIQPAAEKQQSVPGISNKKGIFTLALSVSPDLNSANSFNSSQLGSSLAVGIKYQLSKNLSLSSGIGYSRKLYAADPGTYQSDWSGFKWTKTARSIDADCRVLDIPLNLNLDLISKNGSTIFATAGTSSYLMLKEEYTFTGAAGDNSGYYSNDPRYTVRNKNQHLFGVVNLAIGLEKPVGKQSSIVFQPYAKLPLKGIGQGKASLKSVGLALQFNYSLRKKDQ